jgi:hypothetical protein
MLRIYLLLERLLASEGGLCSVEIVHYLAVKFRHDPSLGMLNCFTLAFDFVRLEQGNVAQISRLKTEIQTAT